MDMKAVLFNIHDVALIVTVVACALLGSRHIVGWSRPQPSGYFFGLFLAVIALVSINTLILWAEPIRHPVFAVVPYLYLFLGGVAFFTLTLLAAESARDSRMAVWAQAVLAPHSRLARFGLSLYRVLSLSPRRSTGFAPQPSALSKTECLLRRFCHAEEVASGGLWCPLYASAFPPIRSWRRALG